MLGHEFGWREISGNFAPGDVGTSQGTGLHSKSQAVQLTSLAVYLWDHHHAFFVQASG